MSMSLRHAVVPIAFLTVVLAVAGCNSSEDEPAGESSPTTESAGSASEAGNEPGEDEAGTAPDAQRDDESADPASGDATGSAASGSDDPAPNPGPVDEALAAELDRAAVLVARPTPMVRVKRPEALKARILELTGSAPVVEAALAELGLWSLDLPMAGRDVTRPVLGTVPEVTLTWTPEGGEVTFLSLPAAKPADHRDAFAARLDESGWVPWGDGKVACETPCVARRRGDTKGVVLIARATDVLVIESQQGDGAAVQASLDALMGEVDAARPSATTALAAALTGPGEVALHLEREDLFDVMLRGGLREVSAAVEAAPAEQRADLRLRGVQAVLGSQMLAHGRDEIDDSTLIWRDGEDVVLVQTLTANGRNIHRALGAPPVRLPTFGAAAESALAIQWRGVLGGGLSSSQMRDTDAQLKVAQIVGLAERGGVWGALAMAHQPYFILARLRGSLAELAGNDVAPVMGGVLHANEAGIAAALVTTDPSSAVRMAKGSPNLAQLGDSSAVVVAAAPGFAMDRKQAPVSGAFPFEATVRPALLPAELQPPGLDTALAVLPDGPIRVRRGTRVEGGALVTQVTPADEWPELPAFSASDAEPEPGLDAPVSCAYALVDAYTRLAGSLAGQPAAAKRQTLDALESRSDSFAQTVDLASCAAEDARYEARLKLVEGALLSVRDDLPAAE